MYVCMYVYIYIYIICICMCVYIYIYILVSHNLHPKLPFDEDALSRVLFFAEVSTLVGFWALGSTHRLHSSCFLRFVFRILNS